MAAGDQAVVRVGWVFDGPQSSPEAQYTAPLELVICTLCCFQNNPPKKFVVFVGAAAVPCCKGAG